MQKKSKNERWMEHVDILCKGEALTVKVVENVNLGTKF